MRLGLRSDATADLQSDGRTWVRRRGAGIALGPLSEELTGLMETLAASGVGEGEADRLTLEGAHLLALLDEDGWLARHLDRHGRPLASVEPVGRRRAISRTLPRGDRIRLSRFAHLRAVDGKATVDSPRARSTMVIHHPEVAGALVVLAAPVRIDDLRGPTGAVAELLLGAGLALALDDERDPEDEVRELAQWSFADLLFHTEHRFADDRRIRGGTYPLAERFPPLPPAKPAPAPDVALPRPEGDPAQLADPPLAGVMEGRRSIRVHDDESPITREQLGEFLFRSARVRGDGDGEGDGPYQPSLRPFPGGGALGELELYPVVRRCSGVPPGLYRYDGREHGLGRLSGPSAATDRLLGGARWGAMTEEPPQILVVIAARVGRVTWKYERIGYALILKHVGVLLQTMYLVATAMELAPCAIGSGDSERFAAASGLDPLEEPSVGEFMLGSAVRASS